VKNIVRGNWKCFICPFKTSTNDKLVDHIEENHSQLVGGKERTYPTEKRKCAKTKKECKKMSGKKMLEIMKKWNLLKNKKQKKPADTSFVLLKGVRCKHCVFRATDRDLLHTHEKDHHNNNHSSNNSPQLQKKSSKGRMTEKSLSSENFVAKNGFVIINGVQCQHCLFRATDKDLLHNHMEDLHNNNINNNNKSLKPFIPKSLNKSSQKMTKGRKKKNAAKQHLVLREGFFSINGLQCHQCKFWATSKDLLDTHNNLRHVKKMRK
jgi:hypothetical protein